MMDMTDPAAASVELLDEFAVAIRQAVDDARSFYASGRRSIVASIPSEMLSQWNGLDEMALVYDPDGIDLISEEDMDKAA